jgi:hypothetical protein
MVTNRGMVLGLNVVMSRPHTLFFRSISNSFTRNQISGFGGTTYQTSRPDSAAKNGRDEDTI